MTRLLDLWGRELAELEGESLRDAILQSEGRVVMAEVIAHVPPLLGGTSNPELVAAFGADLICLNMMDPRAPGPLIEGVEGVTPTPESFSDLTRFLGRPVGLNLEPDLESVPATYRSSESNISAADAGGAAFVMITANPGRGAGIADIAQSVGVVRKSAPHLLCLAGKMHQAGADERLDARAVGRVMDAGAHGVLIPLPGTVPGIDEATAAGMAAASHEAGGIAVGTIGTSQEGAEIETIRSLALAAKRIGVDVHHIGDAGYTGIAIPENVYAYSLALRGRRHTWNRMARGTRGSWGGS
ncbi:MAG TPA: haloacid dehalogenase-like hydrolase [Actinomycetota bacterium]|nr:haloacid dehalogenase-like hydrolase [Actinomycetota bacterium]